MNHNHFKLNKRAKEIRFITYISIIVNLILSIFKILIGWTSGIQSLIADGIHSFTDFITDITIIIGSVFFNKPADKSHPYGHGRIETFITIGIACTILFASFKIGTNAIFSFNNPIEINITWPVLIIAFASIFLNELLYRVTSIYGKKLNSIVLNSNAWHHRIDAFSSIPVLIAAIGIYLFPQVNYLDNIATLIITFMLLKISWNIASPAIDELLEKSVGDDFDEIIKNEVMNFPEIINVHNIKTRKIGGEIIVDFHVQINSNKTFIESHELVHKLKNKLINNNNIFDVLIHIEPK